MMDKANYHYNHINDIRSKLENHGWCRRQTLYDSDFIAWLNRELLQISNEAYRLTLTPKRERRIE